MVLRKDFLTSMFVEVVPSVETIMELSSAKVEEYYHKLRRVWEMGNG